MVNYMDYQMAIISYITSWKDNKMLKINNVGFVDIKNKMYDNTKDEE